MQSSSLVSRIRLTRARSDFFSRGTVPVGVVPDAILRSWQRSLQSGVDAEGGQCHQPILSRHEMAWRTAQNRAFIDQSRPVMENLYEQIQSTASMVILADAAGVILHSLGDADFVDRARKVSLLPGGVWTENVRGTNAIGTALAEQAPVVVHSVEHFASANHFLTCSASPIFDPYGSLLGALDVSGDSRAQQQHTMALVRISAQQIENQMFSTGFEADITLYFHSRPEFIGTLYEAIAVFDRDGRFIAANRSALLHLGVDRYQSASLTFAHLFDLSLERAISFSGQASQRLMQLRTCNGTMVFGRIKGNASPGRTVVMKSPVANPSSGASSGNCSLSLESLESGDPAMQRAIDKARRVLGHDIPLMIEGESGTGKELFARAVHNGGPRRNGPFVALNCAAIPESLIEAELFGYQEGAFTGARRKGASGKIRQADGGTLFLDEIGDMPLALQARLLRVLQERSVTPLGGSETYPVDIAVVCATNRKLREEIVAGRFREDLYYRLNGLPISLPRLRDREDRLSLAHAIAAELSGPGRPVRIGADVLRIFESHHWPGNVRQLHGVLRTAVALLGGDDEITVDHLPEDFMEQYRERASWTGRGETDAVSVADQTNLDRLESIAIRHAIRECRGNLSAAARALGVSRTTLYRKTKGMAFAGQVGESWQG
ncbi:MAG TPA: sigma-54-dependent Fis family transcriptional regulator [Geobacteraceae bacterium]|nr:sigma-54-dependent Fis family transcriptional regulator [Geobacteraceae bacterium]